MPSDFDKIFFYPNNSTNLILTEREGLERGGGVDETERGNVFQVARNRGSGEGGGGHERLWGNLAAFNIMCVCVVKFSHTIL